MLRIGFCGTQGSGKTTLASALAEKTGLQFVKTDVAGIIRNLGVKSCRASLGALERLDLQEGILEGLIATYPVGHGFIADRTPMDVMMYTLSWLPQFPDEAVNEKAIALMNRCAAAADMHFDLIAQLHPGVELSDAEHSREDRAPLDLISLAREDTILTGLNYHHFRRMLNCQLMFMPVSIVSLNKRLSVMEASLAGLESTEHSTFH